MVMGVVAVEGAVGLRRKGGLCAQKPWKVKEGEVSFD
jgi:hypothetical protein